MGDPQVPLPARARCARRLGAKPPQQVAGHFPAPARQLTSQAWERNNHACDSSYGASLRARPGRARPHRIDADRPGARATAAVRRRQPAAPSTTQTREPVAQRVSARVVSAKDIALRQRGDAYAYGAAGPDRFDCSGLVVLQLPPRRLPGAAYVGRPGRLHPPHREAGHARRRPDVLLRQRRGLPRRDLPQVVARPRRDGALARAPASASGSPSRGPRAGSAARCAGGDRARLGRQFLLIYPVARLPRTGKARPHTAKAESPARTEPPCVTVVHPRSKNAVVAALVAASLLLAGCGGGDDEEPPSESAPVASRPRRRRASPPEPTYWPLTGLERTTDAPKHPVIVTKVDNTSSSAPQVGPRLGRPRRRGARRGRLHPPRGVLLLQGPGRHRPGALDARQRHRHRARRARPS